MDKRPHLLNYIWSALLHSSHFHDTKHIHTQRTWQVMQRILFWKTACVNCQLAYFVQQSWTLRFLTDNTTWQCSNSLNTFGQKSGGWSSGVCSECQFGRLVYWSSCTSGPTGTRRKWGLPAPSYSKDGSVSVFKVNINPFGGWCDF